jgi:2-oxoisovalerate dehydrogenase E1 component alpha subunit
VASVAERASGYGMPGSAVDGTDPLTVYAAVAEAARRARAGDGPTLVDANVVRITPHSSDDDDRRYRSENERAAAQQRDPVRCFAGYLREHGVLDAELDQAVRARISARVDEALAYAEQAAPPPPSSAFDYVYADRRMPDLKAALRGEWAR